MANVSEGGNDSTAKKKLDYHPTVRALPKDEQPRQRLRHAGSQALPVAELPAIAPRTPDIPNRHADTGALLRNCAP